MAAKEPPVDAIRAPLAEFRVVRFSAFERSPPYGNHAGKIIRVKAWSGHHLEIKSSRRTRRYAGKAVMVGVHAKQVRRLLPYL